MKAPEPAGFVDRSTEFTVTRLFGARVYPPYSAVRGGTPNSGLGHCSKYGCVGVD